jgi:hypothetical protein
MTGVWKSVWKRMTLLPCYKWHLFGKNPSSRREDTIKMPE